jgi:hypothetical protein
MQKRFSVLPRDIFLSGCYYYNKKLSAGSIFLRTIVPELNGMRLERR